MRWLSWLMTFFLFLLVLGFTLKNPMGVPLNFWPSDIVVSVPLPFMAFGLLCLGFLLGSVTGWIGTLRSKLDNHKLRKELAALQKTLDRTQPPRDKDAPIPAAALPSKKRPYKWFSL